MSDRIVQMLYSIIESYFSNKARVFIGEFILNTYMYNFVKSKIMKSKNVYEDNPTKKEKNNYNRAIKDKKTGYASFEDYKKSLIADNLLKEGNFKYSNGDTYKARSNWNSALEIAYSIDDAEKIASILNNLGCDDRKNGEYEKARMRINEAHELNKKINNEQGIALNKGNLGIINSKNGKYEKALLDYYDSMKINLLYKNDRGLGTDFGNIAVEYLKKRNTDEIAMYYLKKALEIHERVGPEYDALKDQVNIGLIHVYRRNFKTAKDYLGNLQIIDPNTPGALWIDVDAGNTISAEARHDITSESCFKGTITLEEPKDGRFITVGMGTSGTGELFYTLRAGDPYWDFMNDVVVWGDKDVDVPDPLLPHRGKNFSIEHNMRVTLLYALEACGACGEFTNGVKVSGAGVVDVAEALFVPKAGNSPPIEGNDERPGAHTVLVTDSLYRISTDMMRRRVDEGGGKRRSLVEVTAVLPDVSPKVNSLSLGEETKLDELVMYSIYFSLINTAFGLNNEVSHKTREEIGFFLQIVYLVMISCLVKRNE